MISKPNIDLGKIKKEYLLLAGLILVVLIGLFAVKNTFLPILEKIKAASIEIEINKAKVQTAKVNPEKLKTLRDEMRSLNSQVDDYQNRLKAKVDVPQTLKELNHIAEQLGIKFVSVSPLRREETALPGEEGLLLQVPLKIKLRGGYHQLGIFINKIENSPNFMKIKQLSISADQRDIWTHEVELVIARYILVSK